MSNNRFKTTPLAELPLQTGPLCYQLQAYDPWGECRLAELGTHIAPPSRSVPSVDRVVHLHRLVQHGETGANSLPQALSAYLPDRPATLAWLKHDNLLNSVWHSRNSRQSFWTSGADPHLGDFRYQLPWDLVINDMVGLGGGLIHGGLAIYRDEAVLFLAPPGGGKTTTLASAAADWQVLADDSALVWPAADGSWQASPMPTWSSLIRQTTPFSSDKLAAGDHYPIKAIIYLNKAHTTQLLPLAEVEAAPLIYRSLNEYTATVLADPLHRKAFFQTACNMARSCSCWRLELPLGADIWPLLADRLKGNAL